MLSSHTINKAGKREEDSEQRGCSSFKKKKVEYGEPYLFFIVELKRLCFLFVS